MTSQEAGIRGGGTAPDDDPGERDPVPAPAGPDDADPGAAGQASDAGPVRVTTLELFFDLIFAFTLTQLAVDLAPGLTGVKSLGEHVLRVRSASRWRRSASATSGNRSALS